MPIDVPDLITELRRHLFEWLPRQAWFDALDAEVEDVTIIRTETLRRQWPIVMWVPIEVQIDGAPVICQTVLALAPEVPDVVPDLGILGEVPTDGGPMMAYDALADPEAAAAFIAHVADGVGTSTVSRIVDSPWLTTLELSQQWEATLYRRVQAGAHPDVELTGMLAQAGRGLVRPPVAVWRKNHFDLATIRRNVRRGTSGSELAAASVRELLARRCQPRENPLDLIEPLHALGSTLSEMHVALADGFGTSMATGDALADALTQRLPRQLDDAAAAKVAATYRRLGHADDLGAFIRVHGNLDLSSIERTRNSWVFSRFGCSPESDLVFEQLPMSPLCDLAGLLHGFSAAASTVLADVLGSDGPPRPEADGAEPGDYYEQADRRELAVLAEAWEERAVDAIIAGYTSNDDVHRLLPVERISRDALLTLFELELSVRDVVRELSRGPEILRIPVEVVDDLATASVRLRW